MMKFDVSDIMSIIGSLFATLIVLAVTSSFSRRSFFAFLAAFSVAISSAFLSAGIKAYTSGSIDDMIALGTLGLILAASSVVFLVPAANFITWDNCSPHGFGFFFFFVFSCMGGFAVVAILWLLKFGLIAGVLVYFLAALIFVIEMIVATMVDDYNSRKRKQECSPKSS